MLRLTIKASATAATRAALRRGVIPGHVQQGMSEGRTELETSEAFAAEVAAWMQGTREIESVDRC